MFQYGMTFIGMMVLALIGGLHFAVASAVARRDEWMPTGTEIATFCGASVFVASAIAL